EVNGDVNPLPQTTGANESKNCSHADIYLPPIQRIGDELGQNLRKNPIKESGDGWLLSTARIRWAAGLRLLELHQKACPKLRRYERPTPIRRQTGRGQR